ncbi:MAG TPA: hypothetical protein VK563_00075, partial [Puia sp.]|nr:hypothetical protein [Puia sp.]
MAELFVPLILTPGFGGIYLREVRGVDEMVVDDTGTRAALTLIDGLLSEDRSFSPEGGAVMPEGRSAAQPARIDVAKIVTADRDRILAHIYMGVYGPKIASTLTCGHCTEQFDLDFSLDDLLSHFPLDPASNDEGVYEDGEARKFRLPTGEDELEAARFAPEEAETMLLDKCLLTGGATGEPDEHVSLQAKMWAVAPILN